MAQVLIFNERTMRRTRKNFRSEHLAEVYYNLYFEQKKNVLVCPPNERAFTYKNEFGNNVLVQKMWI